MVEPVPCPTCQALLRVPPGAAAVRCPSCKTVLTVEPVAPPPAPAAPPLPFGRPAVPVAAPVRPPAARPAPAGPAKRARLAPDAPDPDPGGDDDRRRLVRQELAELEAKEEKELRKYDELVGQCRYARVGVRLLAFGAVGTGLAAVLSAAFLVAALVKAPFLVLLYLAGGLMVIHWTLALGGFGTCLFGPPGTRGAAGVGLAATLAHMGLNVLTAAVLLPRVAVASLEGRDLMGWDWVSSYFLLTNAACNLTTVSDLPVYALLGFPVPPWALVLGAAAGAAEFAKLSALGILTNRYCLAGKDPDLGYLGLRFVYRIFGLVLAGAVLKPAIYGANVLVASGAGLLMAWAAIPLMLATEGYLLWWVFAWVAQYQVMTDAVDVITADRFVDKRDRLDGV